MVMVDQHYLALFPQEFIRLGVPDWKVLLVFAYDGPLTMYQIKTKYRFKYPAIHRSTKKLETLKWVKIIERKLGEKGHTTKVYSLTLVGLLHLLYRIPKIFRLLQTYRISKDETSLPEGVKTDLRKLHTQTDVASYLLYCFKYDKVAEHNQKLLPLIFGKWDHFKKNDITFDVFSSMTEVAHNALANCYDPVRPTRRGVSLQKLFTNKVYDNLIRKSMFTSYPRNIKGYESYDYHKEIQQNTIAVFQNDPELTPIFNRICTKLEKEVDSLSKSIKKLRKAIL